MNLKLKELCSYIGKEIQITSGERYSLIQNYNKINLDMALNFEIAQANQTLL